MSNVSTSLYGWLMALGALAGIGVLLKAYLGGKRVERLDEAAKSAQGKADHAAQEAKKATDSLNNAQDSAGLQDAIDAVIDAGKPK